MVQSKRRKSVEKAAAARREAAAKRRKILAITMLSQLMFGGCTHTTIIKWQFLFL